MLRLCRDVSAVALRGYLPVPNGRGHHCQASQEKPWRYEILEGSTVWSIDCQRWQKRKEVLGQHSISFDMYVSNDICFASYVHVSFSIVLDLSLCVRSRFIGTKRNRLASNSHEARKLCKHDFLHLFCKVDWRLSLLGWRASLLCWRPSLVG